MKAEQKQGDRRDLADRLAVMVITDPECGPDRTIVEVVEAALRGGAPSVQLRGKEETARELYQLAVELREITTRHSALFVVNDRVDVALACGADGAHIGEDDLPLEAARRIVPEHFLIGRSVDNPEQAARAEKLGADYVGVGPVFATPSKTDTGSAIGMAGITAARRAVGIPLVAIGGLDESNSEEVARSGAHGAAVIRAVMQAPDPSAAAERLVRSIAAGRRAFR